MNNNLYSSAMRWIGLLCGAAICFDTVANMPRAVAFVQKQQEMAFRAVRVGRDSSLAGIEETTQQHQQEPSTLLAPQPQQPQKRCIRSSRRNLHFRDQREKSEEKQKSFASDTGYGLATGSAAIAKASMAATVAAALWLSGGGNTALASDNAEYLSITDKDIQIQSNKKLIDYAVGTVNTQFYDNSGGAHFNPSDFYRQWKDVQQKLTLRAASENGGGEPTSSAPASGLGLDTREGTVETLKYLVSTLKDPYSKYMTREELRYELKGAHDGFLGTGAYIEVPKPEASSVSYSEEFASPSPTQPQPPSVRRNRGTELKNFRTNLAWERIQKKTASGSNHNNNNNKKNLLTNTRVANLPVVSAVAPNSPAERAGLVVGDRIVGVGDKDDFLGYGRDEIEKCLAQKWGYPTPGKSSKSIEAIKDGEEQHRYFGVADLTIAKPVYYSAMMVAPDNINNNDGDFLPTGSGIAVSSSSDNDREIVVGYRSTKVKLPTKATDPSPTALAKSNNSNNNNLRGDVVVQYELLASSPAGGSIFETALRSSPSLSASDSNDSGEVSTDAIIDAKTVAAMSSESDNTNNKVGYVRLTRFSKTSTEGYLSAVQSLEDEGAESYVIDLRNNYGGVIQEAMLTASTLLGDPHAILCYLLNARGGFTPVDVESYVVDARYPGYLLSREEKSTVLQQVMKERPSMFRTVRVSAGDEAAAAPDFNQLLRGGGGGKRVVADWDPPSSYASIHEQVTKRGIHRITYASYETPSGDGSIDATNAAYGSVASGSTSASSSNINKNNNKSSNANSLAYRQHQLQQRVLQKDLVLLINEGTASSAEFFVAALQDNGRSVAVVGTKSFGKGLIQHTFPMPDGGGLKLTIGEFLRPSLRHVTNVFDAKFYDKTSGEIVGGGGIRPDVYCDSKQGIPGNPKADLCVGVALDVLEEQKSARATAATKTDDVMGQRVALSRTNAIARGLQQQPRGSF